MLGPNEPLDRNAQLRIYATLTSTGTSASVGAVAAKIPVFAQSLNALGLDSHQTEVAGADFASVEGSGMWLFEGSLWIELESEMSSCASWWEAILVVAVVYTSLSSQR